MPRRLDPLDDFVFKQLFGQPQRSHLLANFLQAIPKPEVPITSVALLDPHVQRRASSERLTIMDIKAIDQRGHASQVEVQVRRTAAVTERMQYTLAQLYSRQLVKGQDHSQLRPASAIWLLDFRLFDDPFYDHRFRMFDAEHGVALNDQVELHTLELPKWRLQDLLLDDEARWMYFFKEARRRETLPPLLQTPFLEEAMKVLNGLQLLSEDFWRAAREEEEERLKLTYERESERQRTALELLKEQTERAGEELERVQGEAERSRAEADRLRALLEQAGLSP